MKRFLAALAVSGASLFGASGAIAATWSAIETCVSCGPVANAEFFIVGDTGAGPFDTDGITGLGGDYVSTQVSDLYALVTGTAMGMNDMSGWTENFAGDSTQSVTLNILFWGGEIGASTLEFHAAYTRSMGGFTLACQGFDAATDALCGDMEFSDTAAYDRSLTAVPLPASQSLLAMAVLALAGLGLRRLR